MFKTWTDHNLKEKKKEDMAYIYLAGSRIGTTRVLGQRYMFAT